MTTQSESAVCQVCLARPKMDRCDCCEECWYSGRYGRERGGSVTRRADDGPESWAAMFEEVEGGE